jgi:uncharacterized glyoxalase superfamily protein PhnB
MNLPAPAGYTTVAPWIVTHETERLLDFITTVFDGEELGRVPLEDGRIGHAEIRVGDTVLLTFDQCTGWPDTPSLLRIFVPDADATMSRAVAAGAQVGTRPLTQVDHRNRGGRRPGGRHAAPRRAGLCRRDAGSAGDPRPRAQRPGQRHLKSATVVEAGSIRRSPNRQILTTPATARPSANVSNVTHSADRSMQTGLELRPTLGA